MADWSVEHGLQRAEVVTRSPNRRTCGRIRDSRGRGRLGRSESSAGLCPLPQGAGRSRPPPRTQRRAGRRPGSDQRARGASRKPGPAPDASC